MSTNRFNHFQFPAIYYILTGMRNVEQFHDLVKSDIDTFIARHPGFKRILRSLLKTGHYQSSNNVSKMIRQGKVIREFLDYIISSVEQQYEQVTASTIPGAEYATLFKNCLTDLLGPMVTALFNPDDQQTILHHLMESVVILHRDNVHEEIKTISFYWEAVDVAAIYLHSFCKDEFGEQLVNTFTCFKRKFLGKNSGLKCYVSYHYFDTPDSIEEFIVHECAHFLHNNKYKYIGIERKNDEERLVEIAYCNRELFAYSMEFYTKIKLLLSVSDGTYSAKKKLKNQLLQQLNEYSIPIDDYHSPDDVRSLVRQALRKKNGWKWLTKACKRKR